MSTVRRVLFKIALVVTMVTNTHLQIMRRQQRRFMHHIDGPGGSLHTGARIVVNQPLMRQHVFITLSVV